MDSSQEPMAEILSCAYKIYLPTVQKLDSFMEKFEPHYLYLEEIVVQAKKALNSADLELLPKTPSGKRTRRKRNRQLPKLDESEQLDSPAVKKLPPKAKKKLTIKDDSESSSSSAQDVRKPEVRTSGRPVRAASRKATMQMTVQKQLQKGKIPSQQRMASIRAQLASDIESGNLSTDTQNSGQMASSAGEKADDSETDADAEAEETTAKKPKRGKLSRKKHHRGAKETKGKCGDRRETADEESDLARCLPGTDVSSDELFPDQENQATSNVLQADDRNGLPSSGASVSTDSCDNVDKNVNVPQENVDSPCAADSVDFEGCEIQKTAEMETVQALPAVQSPKSPASNLCRNAGKARFSPYTSPNVKSRIRAFEEAVGHSAVVCLSPVKSLRMLSPSRNAALEELDNEMQKIPSARSVVTNLVSAIKNKFQHMRGTPEKMAASLSTTATDTETVSECTTDSEQQRKSDAAEDMPHAKTNDRDSTAVVLVERLSEAQISEIKRSLSRGGQDLTAETNKSETAVIPDRISTWKADAACRSSIWRSARRSFMLPPRKSMSSAARRRKSTLMGRKFARADEDAFRQEVRQIALKLKEKAAEQNKTVQPSAPPPPPSVPPIARQLRSTRTKTTTVNSESDSAACPTDSETEEPVRRTTRTKVCAPSMSLEKLPVVSEPTDAAHPPARKTRTKTRQMAAVLQREVLEKQSSNSEAEEEGGKQVKETGCPLSAPSEAAPADCEAAATVSPPTDSTYAAAASGVAAAAAPSQVDNTVVSTLSVQLTTDSDPDFATPPEKPVRITRSRMPKQDADGCKKALPPVPPKPNIPGNSRKRPSTDAPGSVLKNKVRKVTTTDAKKVIAMSRRPDGGKSDSESGEDQFYATPMPTADFNVMKTKARCVREGVAVANNTPAFSSSKIVRLGKNGVSTSFTGSSGRKPASGRKPFSSGGRKPSNLVAQEGVKTFITSTKKPVNLVTPTVVNGMITSFITRNSPKRLTRQEMEQKKQEELEAKKEKEEHARRKRSMLLHAQALEKRQKREQKARLVLEKRIRKEQMEQEKSELIRNKHDNKLNVRQPKKNNEDNEKRAARLKRRQDAEERRKRSIEERMRKQEELEEERRRKDELMQRKKEFEEQERQKRLAEQKKVMEEKQAEAERQRQEELARKKAILEEQEEWQRMKELRDKQLEKERQARLQEEVERQKEKERLAKKQLEKEKEQELRRLRELASKEENAKQKQAAAAKVLQMHNHSVAKNTTFNATQENNSGGKTQQKTKKRNPDSYDMTPQRANPKLPQVFDNYNIHDINSEDSTDDEEDPRKDIPPWAHDQQLKVALLQQHYNPPNLDEIFDTIRIPELVDMFAIHRRRFHHRSSSAHWQSPIQKPGADYSFLNASLAQTM